MRVFLQRLGSGSSLGPVHEISGKPLLLGSLKFDLRMYVLVAGGCSDSPPVVLSWAVSMCSQRMNCFRRKKKVQRPKEKDNRLPTKKQVSKRTCHCYNLPLRPWSRGW